MTCRTFIPQATALCKAQISICQMPFQEAILQSLLKIAPLTHKLSMVLGSSLVDGHQVDDITTESEL